METSILTNLAGGLGGSSFESISDDEAIDEDENVVEREEIIDFSESDYGYTGGNNFVNPPNVRLPNEPLDYFGYSYFQNNPSTFAPLKDVPVPPDYMIGPNDTIKIILFGSKNSKYELKVTRDGDIFLPEIGPVNVAGITFGEVRELLKNIIANQLIGTQVSITMGSLRAIDIFVLGSASNPGMYSISALSSLTNAIIKSGGIDKSGSLRNIKLKRNGNVISTFDFYDLLLNGDTSNDSRLMQGDVVFIETVGKTVAIRGEVNKPGIYELKNEENLKQLLQYSRNLTPKANLSSTNITRINSINNSFELLSIDMSKKEGENFELESGDVVSIFSVPNNLKNALLISGHAQEPGFYPWQSGMKLLDLFDDPDDLLEMTDLNYALIKRKDTKSQLFEFHQIDLEDLFSNPESSKNIALMDHDEIILFPSIITPDQITTKMIQDRYVLDKETNMMVLESEWTSLTYLRKSLMEEKLALDMKNTMSLGQMQSQPDLEMSESDIMRYYEYSIYDYCTLPEDLAIRIIEESGFRPKKSIPIEDLEQLSTPEDFLVLKQTLERERVELQNENYETEELSKTITSLCRKQLLDPIIDLIERNDTKEKLSLVSVYGNVHFPGQYPLTNQMILSDAIKAAGGPKNGTYQAEIELNTLNQQDKKFVSKNNFASIREASEIKLNEMDTVILKQLATDFQSVEISGEVFFPGTYPITENQTLGDLIRRAGGLTEFGSIDAAYYQREAIQEAEKDRLKSAQDELRRKILLSSQTGGLGKDSLDSNAISQLTSLIASDTNDTEVLGRLVIDLDGILSGKIEDIILEDGDKLHIPKKIQSISVIGEVFVSNSHLFKKDLGIDDYISLSGGLTSFADESNLYLIKSDGSVVSPSQLTSGFFRGGSSELAPGDTIVIPLQVQPFSSIRATTEVTQIIYQMALAAAAVNSF
jgi:polysaccharide export outer membrane protein